MRSSVIHCLRQGLHRRLRKDDGACKFCGEEPTRGERFIAEFEGDAVCMYRLELLDQLPGVELDHYLNEHAVVLEIALSVTISVTWKGKTEERTLIVDDAPLFFDPTWDDDKLVDSVAENFKLEKDEARARLQSCGLLPEASKDVADK